MLASKKESFEEEAKQGERAWVTLRGLFPKGCTETPLKLGRGGSRNGQMSRGRGRKVQ